jgi:hypothetical protein
MSFRSVASRRSEWREKNTKVPFQLERVKRAYPAAEVLVDRNTNGRYVLWGVR